MTAETPLRTMLIDDERLAIDRLEFLCAQLSEVEVVGTAADGEEALKRVAELKPDLLLLDIAMPELGGIEVARALEKMATPPAIIFCTAFTDFAVEAFDVAAVGYLLKPVTLEALCRAISRARARAADFSTSAGYTSEFWVPHRGELRLIKATDIDRIEADRDYMRLHVHGRVYLLSQTIGALEARLDPTRFIRVHRSHIVRRDLIAALFHEGGGVWAVRLADGTLVRIGRNYLRHVRSLGD